MCGQSTAAWIATGSMIIGGPADVFYSELACLSIHSSLQPDNWTMTLPSDYLTTVTNGLECCVVNE